MDPSDSRCESALARERDRARGGEKALFFHSVLARPLEMSVNVRAGAQNCGKLDRCAETRPVPPANPCKRYLHRSTKPAVNVTKSNLTWPSFHNHLCGGSWERKRGRTRDEKVIHREQEEEEEEGKRWLVGSSTGSRTAEETFRITRWYR